MNLNEISTPALAYLGDVVIEMCVREMLVEEGFSSSAHLNKEALKYVCAGAQAEAMKTILPALTEEEMNAFHRGRNMRVNNVPKSASVSEYHTATGMEALFGYLHLQKNQDRIRELFALGYGKNKQGE